MSIGELRREGRESAAAWRRRGEALAALEGTRIVGITRSIIITVEEIAVLLEGGGEISAVAVILRTTTPITERTPPENTVGDERRGRVRLRGEEIAERTEEETEIEDEGILDLDLVRLPSASRSRSRSRLSLERAVRPKRPR